MSSRLFTDTSGLHKEGNRKPMEVKVFKHEFTHPDERKEYLEMVQLGSQFNMRYRAIVHFYGADLIAYKRKFMKNPQVNEFLRIFSAYLTTQLEDNCPPSWDACDPQFWEELITVCFPRYMRVSIKQKETENFLLQLKRFVHWLDRRNNCSWTDVVEKYVEQYASELKTCEAVLKDLHLDAFPKVLDNDWNMKEELDRLSGKLPEYSSTVNSIFEIAKTSDHIIDLYDIDSAQTYQIINFPTQELLPGILIDGVIGKKQEDFYWTLHFTETVFPNNAQKYIEFID